jgi:hypothetical protein
MKRNLRIERLYSLGDYKNIKFYDEIEELPEEFTFNKEVISNIQFLQMLQIEQAHIRYMKLAAELSKHKNFEELETEIESLREKTLSELTKLIKNGNGEKQND